MDNPLIEDAFEVLENATRQEKNGNRVEAATKYFEATYLLKQIYQSTPICHSQIRSLLKKKIDYYGAAASRLYFDERSTAPTMLSNPRSPTMGQKIFFSEGNNREAISPLSSATRSSFTQSQTAELNQTASHANTKLSQAIDLDEKNKEKTKIIEAYMAAAQLYLNTIRLAEISSSSSIASVLKRRLEGALDRVEQLKASSRGDVKKHQSQKRMSEDSNGLTDREIAILKKSSLIASGLFLPFSESDATKLSQQVESNESPSLFTDDKLLPLSSKQQERFYKWARPSEIVKLRSKWKKKELPPPVMIQSVNPYSIRQQYVTDCSFIASLCICAAFAKRFRQRLISKIVYPQNSSGIPIYNPAGKYIVKLWLNGVARQVVIDDQLPVDMHGNLLCSDTKTPDNRLELWVSIIEKAYMKLCGGYNFPGSNSGVDLFSLTGWIPERIFFPCHDDKVRDFETEPERAWERLFSANSFGDCLITVSTSKEIQEAQAQKVGLITGHAYAVLHVIQTSNGIRLLQMKNPWASKGWRGQYSCHDLASWSSALRNETGYDPKIAAQYDDGIFWISWKDVLKYFQNLQLSWNPKLFQHQVMTHDFWPAAQGPKNDTFNVSENPQYTLTLSQEAIKKQATIWILISRHVTKQEQEGADVEDYLTIHVYHNSKHKPLIFYPHDLNCVVAGAYTNNPHVLVRYDVSSSKDQYLSLVLSQHQKSHNLGYTLSCYCTESFKLGKPQKDLPCFFDNTGQWTAQNAGGPVGTRHFFDNPMYVLSLKETTEIQLRGSTSKSCTVNVILFQLQKTSSSENFRALSRKHGKIRLDSGNYRHGFCVTERRSLSPGLYTILVSTFSPGKLGVYSIKITSSTKVVLKEVPP